MREKLDVLTTQGLAATAHANLLTWLTDPLYESFRSDVEALVEQGDVTALNDAFYKTIPFGTGGRRGKMGIGPNRINTYTIASSAQGYANYIISLYGKDVVVDHGLVITYDVRHNSYEFAKVAAGVFAANGIKVYFFDGVRSTPQISFSIRHLRAIGGAMISASHNPPSDNGIKMYGESGGQIVPPHDTRIIEAVNVVTEILQKDFDTAVSEGLVTILDNETDQAYQDAVIGNSLGSYRDAVIVFTPMHGVSTTSFLPVLRRAGFPNVIEVASQMAADGDFPNVKDHSPNPEIPQSLDVAIEIAKENNADVVLAADPDADRIGVVSRKSKDENEFVFLNGNQIGVLLLEYILSERKDVAGGVAVKTIVTSDLWTMMTKKYGIEMIGDLPVGVKYVADAVEHKLNGRPFIFGGEESHGYLYGTYAREKDGAMSGLLISEFASKLKQEGKTLYEQLEFVKKKYGYFRELQQAIYYQGMDGMQKMQRIMDELRAVPPTEIGGMPVVETIDQKARAEFPDNTLAFYLNEEKTIRIIARPSGTEPKIKFYAAVGLPVGEGKSEEEYQAIKFEADELAHKILESVVSHCESISEGGTRFQVLG